MNLKILSIPLLCLLIFVGACSRSEEKAATAAPAASEPAPAPAANEPLSAELVSRLMRPNSPVLGPAKAPVTVVEFLDPACEACRGFAPVVKQIQFLYPEQVRVVVRFANFHPGSDEAIRLLLVAQKHGKFENVLGALFDGQEEWASHHSPDTAKAWELAAAAGLNASSARREAASDAVTARLREEGEDLLALQVIRTPTFYVNGKLLADFGAEQLMALVKSEVEASRSH